MCITQPVGVFVALGIQHAIRMRPIVICTLLVGTPTWHHISFLNSVFRFFSLVSDPHTKSVGNYFSITHHSNSLLPRSLLLTLTQRQPFYFTAAEATDNH
jgi:hypothetical protein